MTRLWNTYRSLPRAVRWAVIAALGMIAYFGIVEPALNIASTASDQGRQIAEILTRERTYAEDSARATGTVGAGMTAFGKPNLPASYKDRSLALAQAVDEILKNHAVEGAVTREKSGSIPDPRLAALTNAAPRADRLILDVSFESEPETVSRVLADLERAPQVTAVSRVVIRLADASRGSARATPSRRVKAELWVEAWIIPQGGRS